MFDEFGWKVPETVSELKTLCETIVSDTKGSVAPFVYPGKVSGGYWDFIGTNWWLQVTGEKKMNEFMKFESSDVFNADLLDSPSYGKLTMLQTFEDIIVKNKTKYIAKMSGFLRSLSGAAGVRRGHGCDDSQRKLDSERIGRGH